MEIADYIATHKDYTESMDALDEGIQTLKAQAHDVKASCCSAHSTLKVSLAC